MWNDISLLLFCIFQDRFWILKKRKPSLKKYYFDFPTLCICIITWASQVALALKNLTANAGDIRDTGYLILRERRMLDLLRNPQRNLFVKKESTGFRGKSTGTGIWKSSSGNNQLYLVLTVWPWVSLWNLIKAVSPPLGEEGLDSLQSHLLARHPQNTESMGLRWMEEETVLYSI